MRFTYGIIFYFSVFLISLTVLLAFLIFKPIRHGILGLCKKFKIGEGPLFSLIFWLLFILVCSVLFDAVVSYLSAKSALSLNSKDMLVDNFDTIKSHQHNDYIILYKQYREYYMAERNFLLTSSNLFILFVFSSFFGGLKKLYDFEVAHEKKLKAQ